MSGSVFKRYATPQQEDHKQPYAPFSLNPRQRREARLRLYYDDGSIGLMSYAYLMEVVCTSHQFISLIYTNCVITIQGNNLFELLDLLQEEKLRAIQCYHPQEHLEPAANEMLIESIRRETIVEAQNPKRSLHKA